MLVYYKFNFFRQYFLWYWITLYKERENSIKNVIKNDI